MGHRMAPQAEVKQKVVEHNHDKTQNWPGLQCCKPLAQNWNMSCFTNDLGVCMMKDKIACRWLDCSCSLCACYVAHWHWGHGTACRTAVVENAISILPLLGTSNSFLIFNFNHIFKENNNQLSPILFKFKNKTQPIGFTSKMHCE